jgi:hypothetical protein
MRMHGGWLLSTILICFVLKAACEAHTFCIILAAGAVFGIINFQRMTVGFVRFDDRSLCGHGGSSSCERFEVVSCYSNDRERHSQRHGAVWERLA